MQRLVGAVVLALVSAQAASAEEQLYGPEIACLTGTVRSVSLDSSSFEFDPAIYAEGDTISPVAVPPAMKGILAPGDSVEVEFNVWPDKPGNVYLLRTVSGSAAPEEDICEMAVAGIGVVRVFGHHVDKNKIPVRLWQPDDWKPGDRIRLVGQVRK